VGLVLTALVLQVARVPLPVVGHGWARLDAADWPVALLPELQRCQRSRPEGTAIFNEYAFGGFLIYYTPGLRVFVDDRCELYGDGWLRDYVLAEGHDAARQVQEWEKQYRQLDHEEAFDLALTRTGSTFDRYFNAAPGWLAVKRTPAAALYQRNPGSLPRKKQPLQPSLVREGYKVGPPISPCSGPLSPCCGPLSCSIKPWARPSP